VPADVGDSVNSTRLSLFASGTTLLRSMEWLPTVRNASGAPLVTAESTGSGVRATVTTIDARCRRAVCAYSRNLFGPLTNGLPRS